MELSVNQPVLVASLIYVLIPVHPADDPTRMRWAVRPSFAVQPTPHPSPQGSEDVGH
jgi:hypothetical protein